MSLFQAIRDNNMELFQKLINEPNCNINQIEKKMGGDSLLHYTILYDRIEMVKILLQFGANVNAKNRFSNTPLRYLHNKIDLLKLMCHYGADVNIQNDDGLSILHYACISKCSSTFIEVILDSGADLSLKTNYGETIFDIAKRLGHHYLSDFIQFYLLRKELWSLWEL